MEKTQPDVEVMKVRDRFEFLELHRKRNPEETVDADWDKHEEECRKLLRSREKEAIRNQLNARKLSIQKEEERQKRAKETLAAWEEALAKLPRKKKEPKSELQMKLETDWRKIKRDLKSGHSSTSSMETHAGGFVPKPGRAITSEENMSSTSHHRQRGSSIFSRHPRAASAVESEKGEEIAVEPVKTGKDEPQRLSPLERLAKNARTVRKTSNENNFDVGPSARINPIPLILTRHLRKLNLNIVEETSAQTAESVEIKETAVEIREGPSGNQNVLQEQVSLKAALFRRGHRQVLQLTNTPPVFIDK